MRNLLHMLDTDTLSLFFRNQDAELTERIRTTLPEQLCVSIITDEEQLDGWKSFVRKAKNPEMVTFGYAELATTIINLGKIPLVGFSLSAQAQCASLKTTVKNIGGNDLRIAAIAMDIGAVLVTRNTRDFERVPGLMIENWVGQKGTFL